MLREGLARVLADTPVRGGYLEGLAGWESWAGPFARAEAGYRPAGRLGLFGFGEWRPGGSMAGIGASVRF